MIIGITGKKFHGKDTVARIILRILFQKFPIIESFASPIKDIVAKKFNIPRFYMDVVELKELPIERLGGKSIRQLLQEYGTDLVRKNNPNHWVDVLDDKLNSLTCPVIIPDCRFDNEAELIRKRRGIIIHVDASKRVGGSDQHESERGISGNLVDYHLDNNGSEKDLEDCLRVIISKFL